MDLLRIRTTTKKAAQWVEHALLKSLGRVVTKTWKTVVPVWPSSCSSLMHKLKGKLKAPYCHWSSTDTAFTTKVAPWPPLQVSGDGCGWPLVTLQWMKKASKMKFVKCWVKLQCRWCTRIGIFSNELFSIWNWTRIYRIAPDSKHVLFKRLCSSYEPAFHPVVAKLCTSIKQKPHHCHCSKVISFAGLAIELPKLMRRPTFLPDEPYLSFDGAKGVINHFVL